MSDKNLCEIKTAFIFALNEQYEKCMQSKCKNETDAEFNLSDLRDAVENLGIKDELTVDEMEEIILSTGFLDELRSYSGIKEAITDKDALRDITQQWALVANLIRCHDEHEDGRHEYPEDFVLSSPGTQSR